MSAFLQHAVAGLAAGGVYATLALGLVLVQRATGVVNVAQGSFATLSAFVCWSLLQHGWTFWAALAVTAALSFLGGAALEQALVRPLADPRALTLLTAGLLLVVDGLDRWVWGAAPRALAGPFSAAHVHLFGAAVPKRELGVLAVTLGACAALGLLLRHTKLGLGLRAAAANRAAARHAGVPVTALAAVSWGLAAALGGAGGVMAATAAGVDPALLRTAILYALAAAAVGRFAAPLAAVGGALVLGAALELLGAYVHRIDGGLRPATALAALLATLVVLRVRPVRSA